MLSHLTRPVSHVQLSDSPLYRETFGNEHETGSALRGVDVRIGGVLALALDAAGEEKREEKKR